MNRRSFFGLGAKIVGAATLGAHIALEKVGAQPKPTVPADPSFSGLAGDPIVDWQASYSNDRFETFAGEPGVVVKYGPVVTRTMSLPSGVYPPAQTTWAGVSYTRAYVSVLNYSVMYRQD